MTIRLFRFSRLLVGSLLLAVSAATVACKDDDDSLATPGFDRPAMLHAYADNLIRPAFNELKAKTDALQTATAAFTDSPDAARLTAVQNAWVAAFTAYQSATPYNFGPAGEDGLRKSLVEEIATFPVSPSKIEGTVTSGAANVTDFNRDARGFLAVEYLLFDPSGDHSAQLSQLITDPKRRAVLTGLTADLQRRVNEVQTAWAGAYADQFAADASTSAGSSTSTLYNEFVKSFEGAKNFKLGLPLGLRPGQIGAEPERVEAYYSGQSLPMLKQHLATLEAIYHGGLQAYLQSVEGGPALATATDQQLRDVNAALAALPVATPLAAQIVTVPAPVETLHTELQQQTRYFKSDMSSLLGIAITYSSGDGD